MPVFKTARGALLGSLARAVQMPPDRRRAANEAQAPLRGWAGFRQRHLFDYNPAATRFWLVLAASGGMAASVSLLMVLRLPAVEWMQILAWTVVVGIAAAFPIEIPRSRHSIAAGDVLIFLLLALHGPAAATLAAAVEGGVAAMRGSTRLSSRVGTMASGAFGMACAGLAFVGAQALLLGAGVSAAPAEVAALIVAALVYFPANTMPQMQVFCLKRGGSLTGRAWFEEGSWVGTLYLVSAVIAGMLSLNAQIFGRSVIAVAVATVGVALAMLRSHFLQQSAEHAAQEARVAAAELESQRNQKRFHAAFSSAAIGMVIVNPEGVVLQANHAIYQLLGHAEDGLLNQRFRSVLHPSDAGLLDRHLEGLLTQREDGFSIELRCKAADGREIWVSLHCAPFDDQAGAGAGLILQLHDISSRRRAEGELQHIAFHDSLTDLANRNCFQERLSVAVERGRADPRFAFAVMFLDLDRFKVVNDSLGHTAGDELLKEVGRRLVAHTRPNDLVARLGGDEFAILLEDCGGEAAVVQLGERLLKSLDQPVRICGTELRPLASIGITFGTLGHRDPDELLRDADLAMYQAKAGGKARLALFDASLHEQLGQRLQLEADLRRAIGEGQLWHRNTEPAF